VVGADLINNQHMVVVHTQTLYLESMTK